MNTLSSFGQKQILPNFVKAEFSLVLNKDILIQFESHTYVLLIENKKNNNFPEN